MLKPSSQMKICVDKITFLSFLYFSNKEGIICYHPERRQMHIFVMNYIMQAIGITGENV